MSGQVWTGVIIVCREGRDLRGTDAEWNHSLSTEKQESQYKQRHGFRRSFFCSSDFLRFCLLLDDDDSIDGLLRKLELVVEIRRPLRSVQGVLAQCGSSIRVAFRGQIEAGTEANLGITMLSLVCHSGLQAFVVC